MEKGSVDALVALMWKQLELHQQHVELQKMQISLLTAKQSGSMAAAQGAGLDEGRGIAQLSAQPDNAAQPTIRWVQPTTSPRPPSGNSDGSGNHSGYSATVPLPATMLLPNTIPNAAADPDPPEKRDCMPMDAGQKLPKEPSKETVVLEDACAPMYPQEDLQHPVNIAKAGLRVPETTAAVAGVSSDSWKQDLPIGINADISKVSSNRTITVLASALTPECTSADNPPESPSVQTRQELVKVFELFSATSVLVLKLLGVLPAALLSARRRWLYHAHCLGYVVSLVAMMVSQPTIYGRFGGLPAFIQLQYGLFFVALLIVWLFVRRQLASPAVLGTLAQQLAHGHFSWTRINWYGRVAVLLSLGLSVCLYAVFSWHYWTHHSDLSWLDHLYVQVTLVLLVQPAMIVCCFPWVLFTIIQLHCHDMRCFVLAVGKGVEQGGHVLGVLKHMDILEFAVVGCLRRSSQSWGHAVALLMLACLDVSLMSLANLLVMEHSPIFVFHHVMVLLICLLVLPCQLLAHAALTSNVFDMEVVPAINRPLLLWAEAWQKHAGGTLLLHLREMRRTWGTCVGGVMVTASTFAAFTVCAVLIFVLALYHTTARQL